MDISTREGRAELLVRLLATAPAAFSHDLHTAFRAALSLLDERETEIERLRAAVWAADELGVAVQKWTDYRDQYGSGDGVQEVRAKEALARYWRVTGGAPGTRDGTAALRRTP